jgi:hypothetical protein
LGGGSDGVGGDGAFAVDDFGEAVGGDSQGKSDGACREMRLVEDRSYYAAGMYGRALFGVFWHLFRSAQLWDAGAKSRLKSRLQPG